MPISPGEERLVTLFSDCHYYFAQPTTRPALHRFDKASYFYIYWNSTRQTSRIEVANNAGTPDQDAFNGHLDRCRIINSYKFPTLVTLEVDGIGGAQSLSHARSSRDTEEWLLPSADPRANQMLYKIHAIDFYFWTQDDANAAVGIFKQLLDPSQLDLTELKPPEQQPQKEQQQSLQPTGSGLSPVVQNLEKIAISDPAYANGQTRNSQNQPGDRQLTLPPPPPPPASQLPLSKTPSSVHAAVASPLNSYSPGSQASQVDMNSPQPERSTVNFTPMAYNPAAPAAPEKIAHREKTPPPEDGGRGTGLAAAAIHDQVPQTSAHTPSQSWGSPPTTIHAGQSSSWGSPPPSARSGYGPQLASSLGYTSSTTPTTQLQSSRSSARSTVPPFSPPPVGSPLSKDPHRHSVAAEKYTPDSVASPIQAIETPNTQFYSTVHQPSRPLQHIQPQYADYLSAGAQHNHPEHQHEHHEHHQQAPPGGWAQYSYARDKQENRNHDGAQYDVHNQVYRPTKEEAHKHKVPQFGFEADLKESKVGKKTRGVWGNWATKLG